MGDVKITWTEGPQRWSQGGRSGLALSLGTVLGLCFPPASLGPPSSPLSQVSATIPAHTRLLGSASPTALWEDRRFFVFLLAKDEFSFLRK